MKCVIRALSILNREFSNVISILLWWVLPKRLEVVRGVHIEYVKLPVIVFFLLTGSLVNGHVLVVRRLFGFIRIRKQVPMIFVMGRDPYLRYTVYHEHCEGEVFIGKKNPSDTYDSFLDVAKYLVAMYYVDGPFAIVSDDDQSTIAALRLTYLIVEKKVTHYLALAKEIKLAHEEMPKELFDLYCKGFRAAKRL